MRLLLEWEGGWSLYDYGWNEHGWRKLNLRREGENLAKRSWWIAHNEERMARTRDLGLLAQHHPEMHERLLIVLGAL